jgi:hypothetical protein
MTLEEFERVVNDPQAAARPYLIGKRARPTNRRICAKRKAER